MRVSVVVPTYRRPDDLTRCLSALEAQTVRPLEIVVVHRAEDEESLAVLRAAAVTCPVRSVVVALPGQVAALNRGLEAALGDIIAITDDDAAPRPDWVARIAAHFVTDPSLSGVGGKDQVYHAGVQVAGECRVVGRAQWWGRCIGNHHLGVGPARPVDILKGANMSYRRTHLGPQRFDARLAGKGAQVANDLAFSLRLRKSGGRLIYDPAVLVDHFPAPRHDADQRSGFSSIAQADRAHNETLALLDFLPTSRRLVYVAWCFTVGTGELPGALQACRLALGRQEWVWARLVATAKGRVEGMKTWLRSR